MEMEVVRARYEISPSCHIRDSDLRSTPKPIPNTELLSTSFLSIQDELSSSYTIWDHAELHLTGGRFPARDMNDLLSSFEEVLAPEINLQIRNNLLNLEESNLGGETALIQSKATIFGNIILDLKRLAHGINDDSGEVGWTQVERRKKKSKSGSSGGREGRESSDVPQGNSRHGGHGEVHGGDDNGDDDDKEVTNLRIVTESPGGKWFKDVERVYVDLSLHRTPPKSQVRREKIGQKISIKDRARIFSEDQRVSASHVSYEPFHEGFVSLYHGTRLSTSQGFSRIGISPFKNDTEFSSKPAFYVTNEVCAAFEFPLFNHLKAHPHDTVAVFTFEVDVAILHGRSPSPSGHNFRVLWFKAGKHVDKWQEFCTYNLYGEPPKRAHGYDVVIGPMCFPTCSTVIPRPGDLIQIALCSKASWDYIGSCVKRMYIERRVGV